MRTMTRVFLIAVVLFTVVSAVNVSAQVASLIRISGTATASDSITFIFHAPPAQPCNQFVTCPGVICTATTFCTPGPIDLTFFANLVATLTASCTPVGIQWAVQVVTGPNGEPELELCVEGVECCIRTGETAGCGPNGESDLTLSQTCPVNNVCNGVACDEILPHVSGLQIRKVPTFSHTSTLTITGTATSVAVLTLIFPPPITPPPVCNTPVSCGPLAGQVQEVCFAGDTGVTLATRLALAIDALIGYNATASGNILTVSSCFEFECCLRTTECPTTLPLSTNCTVNNVCNGIPCDESNVIHTSGFIFQKGATVPTRDATWGMIKSMFE